MRHIALVMVVACGRVNFEPTSGASDGALVDGPPCAPNIVQISTELVSPAIAWGGNEWAVVSRQQAGANVSLVLDRIDTAGTRVASRAIDVGVRTFAVPVVRADSGRYLLAWHKDSASSFSSAVVAYLSHEGELTTPQEYRDPTGLDGGTAGFAKLAPIADGTAIVYSDSRSGVPQMYISTVDAVGKKTGTDRLISTDPLNDELVFGAAAHDGEIGIAYAHKSGFTYSLMSGRRDLAGQVLGVDRVIDPMLSGLITPPDNTLLWDGSRYVLNYVVNTPPSTLRIQRFDATFAPLDIVNLMSVTAPSLLEASQLVLVAGGYGVAWRRYDNGGPPSTASVNYARVSTSGAVLGPVFTQSDPVDYTGSAVIAAAPDSTQVMFGWIRTPGGGVGTSWVATICD